MSSMCVSNPYCIHYIFITNPLILDVPNSGRKLVTLPKRLQWDPEFLKIIKDLDCKKPVIICGDMNVAHQEIGIFHDFM